VDNHAQRSVVGGPDYVTGAKTPLGVAVQKDKRKDHHGYDRKPDAPGFSSNEAAFEIDDAPDPENLACYEDENYGEVDQLKGVELPGTSYQEGNTSKDQQQNDGTPVSADTPNESEESSDPRSLPLR